MIRLRRILMLSALKNFFITFLIAALIFGSAAYFATRFLSNTITGIFAAESSELEGILNPGDNTPDNPSSPNTDNSDVSGVPLEDIQGDSFNMLFIVTDYQPDLFSDYCPDKETLAQMEEDGNTNTVGILSTSYRRPRAVATVLFRADKERKEFTYTVFPAVTRVSTAVGDQSLGDLYNLYGQNYIIDTVAAMTGVTIDYHLLVNVTELYDIVNEMGGFSLYITKELYYNGLVSTAEKPAEEVADFLPLLYTIGKNTIDGSGAIALMMWDDSAVSAAALTERNTLLVNVLSAIMDRLTSLSQAEFTAFYDKICEEGLISTNFTTKDLVSNMGLIRKISEEDFTEKTLDYPGRYIAATDTENAYFSANTSAGITQFKNYRKVLDTDN